MTSISMIRRRRCSSAVLSLLGSAFAAPGRTFLALGVVALVLTIAPLHAQESSSPVAEEAMAGNNDEGIQESGSEPVTGPQAPEETVFVLPDVIVSLPEPEYRDVDALLLETSDASELLRFLPQPGEIGGGTLALPDPEGLEGAGEPAPDSRSISVQAGIRGGVPLSAGADLWLASALGGYMLQFELAFDERRDYLGAYEPGQGSYRWSDGSGALSARGQSMNLGLRYDAAYRGLQENLRAQAAGIHDLGLDFGAWLLDEERGPGRLIVELDAGWLGRILRSSDGSRAELAELSDFHNLLTMDARAVYELADGLPYEAGRGSWGLSLEILYELALPEFGDPLQAIVMELEGSLALSNTMNLSASYSPVFVPGSRFMHPFSLGLRQETSDRSSWMLDGGYRREEIPLKELWIRYPLLAAEKGLAAPRGLGTWFGGAEGGFTPFPGLGVEGRIEGRFHDEYFHLRSGESGLPELQESADSWSLGMDFRVRQSWNRGGQVEFGYEGVAGTANVAGPSHLLVLAAQYMNPDNRGLARIEVREAVFTSLVLPLIELEGSIQLSPHWGIEMSLEDPLAFVMDEGRFDGNRDLTALRTRGFSAGLGVRARY